MGPAGLSRGPSTRIACSFFPSRRRTMAPPSSARTERPAARAWRRSTSSMTKRMGSLAKQRRGAAASAQGTRESAGAESASRCAPVGPTDSTVTAGGALSGVTTNRRSGSGSSYRDAASPVSCDGGERSSDAWLRAKSTSLPSPPRRPSPNTERVIALVASAGALRGRPSRATPPAPPRPAGAASPTPAGDHPRAGARAPRRSGVSVTPTKESPSGTMSTRAPFAANVSSASGTPFRSSSSRSATTSSSAGRLSARATRAVASTTAATMLSLACRWLVAFVETKRGPGADEEPYSCTVTIPDDAIAQVSAEDTGHLLEPAPLDPAEWGLGGDPLPRGVVSGCPEAARCRGAHEHPPGDVHQRAATRAGHPRGARASAACPRRRDRRAPPREPSQSSFRSRRPPRGAPPRGRPVP